MQSRFCFPFVALFLFPVYAGAHHSETTEDDVKRLIKDLKSLDKAIRDKAGDKLVRLGPQGEPFIPVLAVAMFDEEEHVRTTAAYALATIGPPSLPTFVRLIECKEEKAKLVAIRYVSHIQPKAHDVVPILIQHLDNDSTEVMIEIIRTLASIKGEQALIGLEKVIQSDRDQRVREAAIGAIGSFGPDAKPLIPLIIKELDRAGPTRKSAQRSLELLGEVAVPDLAALFSNPKAPLRTRRLAGDCLLFPIPQKDLKSALANAMSCLKDNDQKIRSQACELCGRLKGEGKSALPGLKGLLNSAFVMDKLSAHKAITRIDAKAEIVVAIFQEAASDKHEEVRTIASDELMNLGKRAKDCIPSVIVLLNDKEDHIRLLAAHALTNMGPSAITAVSALTKVKEQDESATVRKAAESALRAISRE
jgi:HEAT repeat protein